MGRWKPSRAYRHDYAGIIDKLLYKINHKIRKSEKFRNMVLPLYASYRHRNHKPDPGKKGDLYMTEEQTKVTGFGHGFGSWRAGYINACELGLKYAYTELVSEKWEKTLGLGHGETRAGDLLAKRYKKVRLPFYDMNHEDSRAFIRQIIESYADEKVVFYNIIEQRNSLVSDQIGNEFIRKKFWSSPARDEDKVVYDEGKFSIALHIRRGDVAESVAAGRTDLLGMWLDNSYYVKLLDLILGITGEEKTEVYVFSEGKESDFPEFEKYGNIKYVLNGSPQEAFINLCYADLLITASSSFSREAGDINKNPKLATDKQKGYPRNGEWLLVHEDGSLYDGYEEALENYLKSVEIKNEKNG